MSKGWQKLWLIVAGLVGLLIATEIIKTSRTEAVIGEVHHQRQRQVELHLFDGPVGRLTANKYLAASQRVSLKILETVDPNIIFFAGHPNERVGVEEKERINWLFIPFFIWGFKKILEDKILWRKNVVFLLLTVGIMWGSFLK